MSTKKITLSTQIKKEFGNRIVYGSLILMLIIVGLTISDISTTIRLLPARVNTQVKPLADFAVNQFAIDNAQTIALKLSSFNERNPSFQVHWFSENAKNPYKVYWHFPFNWRYNYPLENIAGQKTGYFQINGSFLADQALMSALILRISLILMFALTLFIFLYPLAKKIPDKLFISPINRFLDLIDDGEIVEKHVLNRKLPTELAKLEERILSLIADAKEHERNKAAVSLGNLVARVAHDIRSPLAALNVMVRGTSKLPEQQRIMIRNATQRINDIANNLLSQYRHPNEEEKPSQISCPELISALLDSIVSEKRLQYQEKNVVFQLEMCEATQGIFSLICAADFKRVLSNLINNAVEAISADKAGHINISLKIFESSALRIAITDNGCGIPQDLQVKILHEGMSTGKPEGSGIGLASSRQLIESWGGELTLQSSLNLGTTVLLTLPRAAAPAWFLPMIKLNSDQLLIVLDDDESIHDIWNTRLMEESANLIKIQHFYTSDTLINAYPHLPSHAFFLIDYELHGGNMSGIEVIQKLSLAGRAALVTSRADEPTLRAQCQALSIKLLPKAFANYIPIIFQQSEKIIDANKTTPSTSSTSKKLPELIFIDDDLLILDAWRFNAFENNKSIVTFNSIDEARAGLPAFPKTIPIYIDFEISREMNGEKFSKELYDLGYQVLYLATGHPARLFAHCYWLSGIKPKDPPFSSPLL